MSALLQACEQFPCEEGFPRTGLGNPPQPDVFDNDVLRALFERRSIRRYTDEAVDPDQLDVVVSAGLRAASAGGCQAPVLLVSQDRETNLLLGRVSNEFYDEGYYPVSKAQPSIACGVGITDAFYGAPVVVTVFTPPDWAYSPFDAAMCVANMMTAAWSLGLGSCVVSRASRTFATPEGREVASRAGIPVDFEAQIHLVLGHPASTDHDSKPLYPNRVSWM